MNFEDLQNQLRERSAFIVHFSHHANTRAGGTFPEDLQAAAGNSWPLSCCVVWPSHRMSLPGSIGIMLSPRSEASIVGIKSSDAGYSTDAAGVDHGLGEPLSQQCFDQTFLVAADSYNEWRIRAADVVGIYCEKMDGQLYGKKAQTLCDPETGHPLFDDIVMSPIQMSEVHASFPGLPVYVREGDTIIQSCVR